jgi:MFS family permease
MKETSVNNTLKDAQSHPPDAKKNSPVRAAVASMAGGTLEYYDNYIYALAAALVFGKIFFPESGGVATIAALATFAVSYIARPIGAILLGHFGDRIGRKKVLVFILVLMGTATFLVGCLPNYAQIGVWAPILLVTLRILQGISVAAKPRPQRCSPSRYHLRDAGLSSQASHPTELSPASFWQHSFSCPYFGAARRPAAELGMARTVPAERFRYSGRIHHPLQAR